MLIQSAARCGSQPAKPLLQPASSEAATIAIRAGQPASQIPRPRDRSEAKSQPLARQPVATRPAGNVPTVLCASQPLVAQCGAHLSVCAH